MLEQSLRAREKEVRALESKAQAQDETMQNINRILEQQDRTMAALTTLQHLYATATSMREVAGPFLELAVKAARCEGGVLALRERSEQKHLEVMAAIGERQDVVRQLVFNEAEGILGEVVKSSMPLFVPDARREPRLRKEGPDFIQREARNALCVPVAGGACVWGALLLVNTIDRKRFNRQDIDLQSIFAMRLARELDREADLARAHEETVRFSALLRATELLHVATDRQKICDLLIQLAVRLAKAAGAAVFLLDESQQMLSCAASSERQPHPVQVPVGAGVAGWVVVEGKPLNSVLESDPRFAGQVAPVFGFKVETVLAVPVRGAQRIIGVLEVVNRLPSGAFDQSDANTLSLLAREAGIALDHVQQARQDQRTIMELFRGMARFLDAKAPHMAGHSERVAAVARAIAEEMRLAPDEANQAYLAGLMHDLGNIGVDDEVFMAARPLTAEETERVRQHALVGAEVMRDVGALRPLMVASLYHHERYDGTGYPHGLKGDAIPLLARIVGVSEAFDAVRSSRPYRAALSLPDALAHIRSSENSVYDPKVVSALIGSYQRGKLPA